MKVDSREIPAPPVHGLEVCRIWKTEDGRIAVTLDMERGSDDPDWWGMMLHDVAKNIALAFERNALDQDGNPADPKNVLAAVIEGFLDEAEDPTTTVTRIEIAKS